MLDSSKDLLQQLPPEVLHDVRDHFTIGCHVSFSQTSKSNRALYDDSFWQAAAGVCGFSLLKERPTALPRRNVHYDAPTWSQQLAAMVRHVRKCKLPCCTNLMVAIPGVRPAETTIHRTQNLKANQIQLIASKELVSISPYGYQSLGDHCILSDEEDDSNPFIKHLPIAASFATNIPVISIGLLVEDRHGVERNSGSIGNPHGVIVYDALSLTVFVFGGINLGDHCFLEDWMFRKGSNLARLMFGS